MEGAGGKWEREWASGSFGGFAENEKSRAGLGYECRTFALSPPQPDRCSLGEGGPIRPLAPDCQLGYETRRRPAEFR